MSVTFKPEKLSVDIQNIEKIANIIKEETEGYLNDLKSLEQCINELECCWDGMAAQSFHCNISIDFNNLENLYSVFSKLSDDYLYAVEIYRKTDQRSYDIVNAINDI